MTESGRPIVVGGGAAGLAACLTLEAAGHAPILLESSDRLGGRLRTERMDDGTPVDVGFQVLLTAYPELQRWVDASALQPVSFVPGAMILKAGRWKTVADPRRWPSSIPATLTSGVGTWGDRIRILRLVGEACSGSPESIQNGGRPGTTQAFLRGWGFSDAFIREFLQPFFSGIFLDADLTPPPDQFLYTLRMFASGSVVRPAAGIEALVHQLVSRLERTDIRLNTRVVSTTANSVAVEGGTKLEGDGVISTVERREDVQWNTAFNAVFACENASFGRPIIGLLPEAQCVTNLHFMEDVQGQEGKGKLNVTALPVSGSLDADAMESRVKQDLEAAGFSVGACLWRTWIRQALPALPTVAATPDPVVSEEGVYLAGDHLAAPSLDAALRSGRVAAEHWMKTR